MTIFIEPFTLAAGSYSFGASELVSNNSHDDRATFVPEDPYEALLVADGATAYWPFQEGQGGTAQDVINGNSAISAAPQWLEADGPFAHQGAPWSEGAGAASRRFAATHSADLAMDWDTCFSVEFWYRLNDASSTLDYVWAKENAGGTTGVRMAINKATGVIQLTFQSTTGRNLTFSSALNPVQNAQAWHHIVFNFVPDVGSRNLTFCELYVDGVKNTNIAQSGPLVSDFSNTGTFDMGGANSQPNDGLRGSWTDFAYYAGMNLSAGQVVSHYDAGVNKGTDVGRVFWNHTLDGSYPYGAQVRAVLIPGWLGRLQSVGDTQLHARFTIQFDGGSETEVRPNEMIPNLITGTPGALITLNARFYTNSSFDTNIFSHIEKQSDGNGPSLVLDSQITGVVPGTGGVVFVVKR